MRIDGASKSNATVYADVGDLMNRLDAGDVVRAKVIEISSDEAVLRLFDGTSIKAKLAGMLDASVGQTITLSVSSKSEGALVLETVRDIESRLQIKPDILKNILESLNLKPDSKNTGVASELLKAGQPVTNDSIGKALRLMEATKGLTTEKAVFLSTKNINTELIDPKIAAKFLNGELKLGDLLSDLQAAVEKALGNADDSDPANNGSSKDISGKTGFTSGSKTGTTTGTAPGTTSEIPDSAGKPAVVISGSRSSASEGYRTNNVSSDAAAVAGTPESLSEAIVSKTALKASDVLKDLNAGLDNNGSGNNSASVSRGALRTPSGSLANTETSGNIDAGSGSKNTVTGQQASESGTVRSGEARNNVLAGTARGDSIEVEANYIGLEKDSLKTTEKNQYKEASGQSNEKAASLQEADESISGRLSKLTGDLKSAFVGTDQDKLAEALDVGKLYKELHGGLDAVKSAVHVMNLQGTQADVISSAANMLSDAVRLIDQLNSGGMMYYQIPVKISDTNTTAELYIMKRQRSKKKLDPGNTVMFISLDTVHMGRVETLIDVKGKNVGIQLRTEKQEISEYIKEYTKDIYKGLSELGYKLTGIRFKIIDEPADPVKQDKLLREMEKEAAGRVDFRI